MEEVFKKVTVEPYSKVYEVSNQGSVKSLGRWTDNNGKPVWIDGKILNGSINKYRRNEVTVSLCYLGKKRLFKVHHLVAWAFPEICGEWFEGAEVDHIDGNPMNNYATNLQVTDRKGNMANPITREKIRNGWNDERREEQSERMKGCNNPVNRCMTEEWRAKMGQGMKGRHHTEETKRKMSEKSKGKRSGANSVLSKKCGCYDENGCLSVFDGINEASLKAKVSKWSIENSIHKNKRCKNGLLWVLL